MDEAPSEAEAPTTQALRERISTVAGGRAPLVIGAIAALHAVAAIGLTVVTWPDRAAWLVLAPVAAAALLFVLLTFYGRRKPLLALLATFFVYLTFSLGAIVADARTGASNRSRSLTQVSVRLMILAGLAGAIQREARRHDAHAALFTFDAPTTGPPERLSHLVLVERPWSVPAAPLPRTLFPIGPLLDPRIPFPEALIPPFPEAIGQPESPIAPAVVARQTAPKVPRAARPAPPSAIRVGLSRIVARLESARNRAIGPHARKVYFVVATAFVYVEWRRLTRAFGFDAAPYAPDGGRPSNALLFLEAIGCVYAGLRLLNGLWLQATGSTQTAARWSRALTTLCILWLGLGLFRIAALMAFFAREGALGRSAGTFVRAAALDLVIAAVAMAFRRPWSLAAVLGETPDDGRRSWTAGSRTQE